MHKVIGGLNKKEALKALDEIYSSNEFDPMLNVLWDFANADVAYMTLEEVEEISDYIISNLLGWGYMDSIYV